MQALEVLAEKYELFEETMKKVTHETEEGDTLFAVAHETMKELNKTQKDQDRLRDEMEVTRESTDIASREFTYCWAHLDTKSATVEPPRCHVYRSEEGVPELKRNKRKAGDAHAAEVVMKPSLSVDMHVHIVGIPTKINRCSSQGLDQLVVGFPALSGALKTPPSEVILQRAGRESTTKSESTFMKKMCENFQNLP